MPGLYSKPIIDIILGVVSLDNNEIAKYKKSLTKLDYQYIHEGREKDFLFVKGPESNRTHHLHLIELDSSAWYSYINFRDFLINNPNARKKYSDFKEKIATKFVNDREAYTVNKREFIEQRDHIGDTEITNSKIIHKLPFLKQHIATFELIKAGKKKIETRAGNPEYLQIKVGDSIEFSCQDQKFIKQVKKVSHYKNLDDLFKVFKPEEINPTISSYEELIDRYASFPDYGARIKKYGILVLELK